MRRNILLAFFLLLPWCGAIAQSSMTDTQVLEFVLKEHKKGTSQSEIVTKLVERGVDIQQIRRVKKKYENKNSHTTGMSSRNAEGQSSADRTRQANGKEKDNVSPYYQRQLGQTENPSSQSSIMGKELAGMLPDSLRRDDDKSKNGKAVFGRDIFNNKNLSFEPNMNIATPKNYVLGPGDAVYIDIYGASQKTIEATVSPDGNVLVEGYGLVSVSGLTIEQANARLRQNLGARYSGSKIQLSLGQTRTISVNVMGEVKTPGTYTLSAFASVFHALYMAGGINEIGTLRDIKVYRKGKLVSSVDVYDYILNGKLKGNVCLSDNDVIVVGPYDCLVNLTGKVKRPMFYEMKKDESLGTLLAYGGGFAGDAYTKSVRIVRKTGREYSVYNVSEFNFNTFKISDEDSVSVDSVLPRYNNMVELRGAVFRPGMYEIGKEITSVRTLLEYADGLKEDAFANHAIIHRMRKDRTLEVIPVDVAGIMDGKVSDVPLQNEDVFFIPSQQEKREAQTITIHGEVYYPGVYQYAEEETIEDFILQAGGLKETASTVKVDVARRIINQKATSSDSVIAQTFSFSLKDGFVLDGQPGFKLKPYDEVYVRKSPGYFTQQNISVEGEVMFAGTYTLNKKNTRLSDVIKAAGGMNDRAYVKGARLERQMTREERLRTESLLRTLRQQKDEKDTLDVSLLELGNTYYVGIELEKALADPGGDDDVVLREGDRVIVPQYTSTVKISGNVMYPNTVGYEQGKKVSYYINQAGGYGNRAKKNHAFIIYMNGKVAKVSKNAKPAPGCEIVVPSKLKRDKMSTGEWIGIGTGAASVATMIATIANL